MKKRIIIFVALFLALVFVQNALAANPLGDATTKLNKALGGTGLERELEVSVGTVINGLLSLVGTIFLVLTIYAGILWMTAQGNDEKVSKAKGILETAVIGLAIVMAAYAITAFVSGRLAGDTTTTCDSPNVCYDGSCPANYSSVGGECSSGQVCCSSNLGP